MRLPWLSTLGLVAAVAVASTAANAEGSWSKDPRGTARHAQSGFACPVDLLTDNDDPRTAQLETVLLQTVIDGAAGRPAGHEAGCEYEGKGGSWATVEFVKLNASESASARYDATRDRIKARFPEMLRSIGTTLKPQSPTGGKTYAAAYYNIRVGDRHGSVAAVGGEVRGWMITVIQFDYDREGDDLEVAAVRNWQRIATSR